jgi:hypothetical protein
MESMQAQIFISHSAKDTESIRKLAELFRDTNIKQVLMEFETYTRKQRPNWQWILEEIKKSRALFVILTKNVSTLSQTRNWVAFEIGVAAAYEPSIPVYVFREDDVVFPVPYLSVYFPYTVFRPLRTTRISASKPSNASIFAFRNALEKIVTILISGDQEALKSVPLAKCNGCLIEFRHFVNQVSFSCPCCSSKITDINWNTATK